ncbi:CYTH domain-containing protein [Shinella kummerowiae]|jgi:adenylate cyclase|uniref:CYTH domain-containing protein n=1 Tax=Shinella kummerowiae TaxID=417745 RepID=A0A6N8SFV3_9HYPH|nr:CYTH domain-containing protein [Shinella kummerowiae]MXN47397.1 CYTH domain-containing protein [Shinella kummerowiae]
MAKEIERKFLVSGQRWRTFADEGIAIRQAYIVAQDDRSLRVRIFGNGKARITLKIGHAVLVRDEYEYDIDRDEAEDMLRHAIGNAIEKVRYKVPHEGHVWEVDVYGGAHKGLIIAEVELASIHDEPNLPNWVGREVTGESQYSNQSMALGVSNGASLRQLA